MPRLLICLGVLLILGLLQSPSLSAAPKARPQGARPATATPTIDLTLAPASVTFPFQAVGTTSYAVTVTLTNYTGIADTVKSVSLTGDFAQSNTCASVSTNSWQCAIDITFTPKAEGLRTGILTVTDGAGGTFSSYLYGSATGTGAGATYSSLAATGSAGAYTLNAAVIGPSTKSGPTGSVSFVDTSNSNLSLGSATLGTPLPGLNFGNGPTYATGALESSAVTVADFNGDGKADVAVVSGCSVSIWLGNGDGTLTASPTVTLSTCATSIVAGDFNGDHKVDLALDNGASNVAVLYGNGDGTFTISSVSVTNSTGILAKGDFNGDGIDDLVVLTGTTSYSATVLLGQSNKTFVTKPAVASSVASVDAVAVADFSGGGKADIAVVGESSANHVSVDVLRGNGDGTFQSAVNTDAGASFGFESGRTQVAAPGDFNGDGKIDLGLVGSISGTPPKDGYLALLSKGDGSFTVETPVVINNNSSDPNAVYSSNSVSIVSEDFDGDGKADLGLLDDFVVTVYRSNGDGTFTQYVNLDSGGETAPDYLSLASGDFNSDGVPDLVVVDSDSDNASLFIVQRVHVATATLANVSVPGAGNHNVEASYDGDANFGPSTSAVVALTGSPVATKLSLSASSTSATAGAQITLTATLSPASEGSLSTSGETVTFMNNGTSIGTAALSSSGVATLKVSTLPAGTDSVTATYAGDTNFVAASATAVSILITTSGPGATVSPAALTFTSQGVGSTSAAQTVTVSNSGSAALSISSVAASGDFAETQNCGTSVAPGGNCTISVTFTPTAGGSRTGTLTITDNAGGSPQTVSLTGTGSTLSLASTSTALSITSVGSSATASLQLTSVGGFSGAATLTCQVAYQGTGTPNDAPTCSLSPTQVNISGTSSGTSTLTVNSTAAAASLEKSVFGAGGTALAALFFFALVPRRRRGIFMLLALLCVVIAGASIGCGGSSHSTTSSGGTTTGSYKVSVTATSGSESSTITLPLAVQ